MSSRVWAGGGENISYSWRYEKSYSLEKEWVYNDANLAAARVIFAHDFDDAKNRELIARYPARSVWLCTVSRRTSELDPYSAAGEDHRSLNTERLR